MSLVAWYPLNGNLKNNCVGPNLTTNYMYGDVNKDGLVNDKDTDELHNVLVETNTDSISKTLGDVDGDGKTNSRDYLILSKYLNNDRQIDLSNRVRQASNIVRKEPIWVDGKTGKAYSNTTEIPAWANIDKIKGTKILSISFWFKADKISQFEDILGFETYKTTDKSYRHLRAETNYAGSDKLIHWFNNDHLSNSDGLLIDNSPDDAVLGKWIHVTSIFEEDKATMYINGKQTYSRTYPNSHDDIEFTGYFYISNDGHDNHSGASGDFRVCNVKIYNHVLSKKEILEDYKQPILHYSFENPYAMETTNISHKLIIHDNSKGEATLGSDSTGNYVNKTGMTYWSGIGIDAGGLLIKPGRYYTWSMEVMSIKDIEYVIDGNITCYNSSHEGNDGQHFDIIRGYSHLNHKLDGSDTLPKGKLEKYKWTKIYFTVKVKQDCTNPYISHTFVPFIPSGDSSVKVYYRNSQLEERINESPYATNGKRNPLTIKDNSGMGNNGTQVYQRIELPLIPKTQTTCSTLTKYGGVTNTYNSTNKTYTLNNFINTENAVCLLATMKYNNSYHYVGSVVSYEFDITLKDIATVSGVTPEVRIQGPTILKDDTFKWDSNPVSAIFFTPRLNNLKNGTYHVYIEKTIENVASNIDYYELGMRFDGIKSGTFTVSNLHAYYQNLETSKLTIADKSAVGSYSAYFNGKNYIDCGLVTPLEIDELTLSCWAYRDDWTTLLTDGPAGSALISSVNAGGFGFKIEKCVQESINKSINFVLFYKDAGYLEHVKSYGMAIDYTKLSSGWHLITGVATRNKATLYIDGEKVRECVHNLNKPIYNYDTTNKKRNNLLVGAECEVVTKPPAAVGVYIDDVRLYATALDDKDVKALYNVKTKVDNKSNLYCNQLVETKSKNMMKPLDKVDLNTIYKFYSTGTVTYSNGIIKYLVSSGNTSTNSGMYVNNVNYGGPLLDNVKYRCEFYVRISKRAVYLLGEERLGFVRKTLESGKWYYIKQEAKATNSSRNLIVYNESKNLTKGDTIEIRDIKIERLYNTEDYTQEITKKGQFKTFELNELYVDNTNYEGATIVDKHNAEWLEVFYHKVIDSSGNIVLYSNLDEAMLTNSEYKYSILAHLEKFRNKQGNFEFLLEYPDDLPNEYNRWVQTDNPVTVTEDITGDAYDAKGYKPIHIDWNENRANSSTHTTFSGLLRSSAETFTLLDGSIGHGNWHTAIGAISQWKDGIPGPYSEKAIKGRVSLYVRIDDVLNTDNFKIYNRNTKANEVIEI